MAEAKPRLKGIADLYAVDDARHRRGQPTSTSAPIPTGISNSSPVESTPDPKSTPVDLTPVESLSGVEFASEPLQKTPDVESTPGVESTPVKRGFLRLPNHVVDNVLPTLKPAEQVVLLRLYRLSHGFGKSTCTVSLATLATACFMSESATRFAVRNVEGRGLIRSLGTDNSNSNKLLRGMRFEVLITPATGIDSTPGRESIPGVESKPIKGTNKRNNKSGEFVECPDCKGSGWYYPEGVAKGVKRCAHTKMK